MVQNEPLHQRLPMMLLMENLETIIMVVKEGLY